MAPENQNGGGQPPPTPRESDADRWYRTVIQAQPAKYDTDIPKDVWVSWFPLWNPQTQKFKGIKYDANNQPIAGEFDKPTDCPDGTTAYGQSQCLPLDHPKVLGVRPGQPGAQPVQEQGPVTFGKSLSYTGNPLVDMLLYQFNNRRSLDTGEANIFGWAGGRKPIGLDKYGMPTADQPDVTGRLLSGGGLWWGGKDAVWQPPGGGGGTPAPSPGPTPPPYGKGGEVAPEPDVAGGPVQRKTGPQPGEDLWTRPVGGDTAIQRMLRQRKQSWYDPLQAF